MTQLGSITFGPHRARSSAVEDFWRGDGWRPESSAVPQSHCPYCAAYSHNGLCPRVKAIEYYPNGTVKRVELKDET